MPPAKDRPFDLLLIGATGYTARLVISHLLTYPRSEVRFGLAARSQSKLASVRRELGVPAEDVVPSFELPDLMGWGEKTERALEELVSKARVVVQLVGPYQIYGEGVVRACVRTSTHYTDLTGESPWYRDMIVSYDYGASVTRTILVPSCGLDSLPSDLAAFLSVLTIQRTSPSSSGPPPIVSSHTTVRGSFPGGSGGTLASGLALFEEVEKERRTFIKQSDWALAQGIPNEITPPKRPLVSYDPYSKSYGHPWPIGQHDTLVVHRSASLLPTLYSRSTFAYREVLGAPGPISAFVRGLALAVGLWFFSRFSIVRALVKRFGPKSGEGPTTEQNARGWLELTNTTVTADSPPLVVQSRVTGKGHPGYALTAILIAETALTLAHAYDRLPARAKEGGVLTPAVAGGEALLERLERTGRWSAEGRVLEEEEGTGREGNGGKAA